MFRDESEWVRDESEWVINGSEWVRNGSGEVRNVSETGLPGPYFQIAMVREKD